MKRNILGLLAGDPGTHFLEVNPSPIDLGAINTLLGRVMSDVVPWKDPFRDQDPQIR